jgi:hypothetical protein
MALWGKGEVFIGIWVRRLDGKSPLEEPGIDCKIILKRISK